MGAGEDEDDDDEDDDDAADDRGRVRDGLRLPLGLLWQIQNH